MGLGLGLDLSHRSKKASRILPEKRGGNIEKALTEFVHFCFILKCQKRFLFVILFCYFLSHAFVVEDKKKGLDPNFKA